MITKEEIESPIIIQDEEYTYYIMSGQATWEGGTLVKLENLHIVKEKRVLNKTSCGCILNVF